MTTDDRSLLGVVEFPHLFHIRRIVDGGWDALNESLLLKFEIGDPQGTKTAHLPVSLDPAAAEQLRHVLAIALAERPPAGRATQ